MTNDYPTSRDTALSAGGVDLVSKDITPLIRLLSVSKTFRMGQVEVKALRGVSLDIASGELVVILGPSGSGKTTLLNLIGGLDTADSGQIVVRGRELAESDGGQLTEYRREMVGFIFQFFNLIPTLTAVENVEFAVEMVEPDARRASARSRDLLERVGLEGRGGHFPSRLSGGEQQRVAIARALAKEPPLLLCDEPTGNLDYRTGVHILELLREVTTDGRACVLVTHNSVIGEVADRVVHLRDGRVDEITVNAGPRSPSQIRW